MDEEDKVVEESTEEEVIEEQTEDVQLVEHEAGDAPKWDAVYARLDSLESQYSAAIARIEDLINSGGTINDGEVYTDIEDTTTASDEDTQYLDDMNAAYIQREREFHN